MIRLRTNSGILPLKHLQLIKTFLEKYDIEKIHLTTRQAIQLHDLSIDNVCDIMEKALNNGLIYSWRRWEFPKKCKSFSYEWSRKK